MQKLLCVYMPALYILNSVNDVCVGGHKQHLLKFPDPAPQLLRLQFPDVHFHTKLDAVVVVYISVDYHRLEGLSSLQQHFCV